MKTISDLFRLIWLVYVVVRFVFSILGSVFWWQKLLHLLFGKI